MILASTFRVISEYVCGNYRSLVLDKKIDRTEWNATAVLIGENQYSFLFQHNDCMIAVENCVNEESFLGKTLTFH